MATRFADVMNYRGSWVLGALVDRLDGAASAAFVDRFEFQVPPRYSEEAYERATTWTL